MENTTVGFFDLLANSTDQLSELADVLRARNVHLVIDHLGVILPSQSYYSAGAPYAAIGPSQEWIEYTQNTRKELLEAQKDSRAFLQKQELSGEARITSGEPATLGDIAAQRSRICDLAILSNGLREAQSTYSALLYNILFHSGGPVMINATAKSLEPDHIMIAWNETLQAARAVRLALPLLRMAKTVTLATFDASAGLFADGEDPGADPAKWLSHHGCNVTLQQFATGGRDVGTCILKRGGEVGADLIVMGGYAHTRLRQAIFGGTTKTVVEQTDVPVFLAH